MVILIRSIQTRKTVLSSFYIHLFLTIPEKGKRFCLPSGSEIASWLLSRLICSVCDVPKTCTSSLPRKLDFASQSSSHRTPISACFTLLAPRSLLVSRCWRHPMRIRAFCVSDKVFLAHASAHDDKQVSNRGRLLIKRCFFIKEARFWKATWNSTDMQRCAMLQVFGTKMNSISFSFHHAQTHPSSHSHRHVSSCVTSRCMHNKVSLLRFETEHVACLHDMQIQREHPLTSSRRDSMLLVSFLDYMSKLQERLVVSKSNWDLKILLNPTLKKSSSNFGGWFFQVWYWN